MSDKEQDKYVTLSEAAAQLGVSTRTVQRRIDKGILQARKERNQWYVCLPDVVQLVDIKDETVNQLKNRVKELEAGNEKLRQRLDEREKHYEDRLAEKDKTLEDARQAAAEASHRHDTVVMQMTRLLEYHQQPFWRKLFSRKALPPPVDETVMDMEPGEKKEKG